MSARRFYFLTAIGPDRPGIVARVARTVADAGGNIEDAAMSRFRDWFAVMVLASFGAEAQPAAVLEALGDDPALRVDLRPVRESAADAPTAAPTHRLSVYGSDKAGVVARVAEALLERGANVLDLEVDVARRDGEALFVMVLDVQADDAALAGLDGALRGELQMEVHVVPLGGVVL